MPSITIELDDLHKIVAALHEIDVQSRTRLRVLERLSATDHELYGRYAVLIQEVTPQVGEERLPFYRRLIDAFVAGDVPRVQSLLHDFADRVNPQR